MKHDTSTITGFNQVEVSKWYWFLKKSRSVSDVAINLLQQIMGGYFFFSNLNNEKLLISYKFYLYFVIHVTY